LSGRRIFGPDRLYWSHNNRICLFLNRWENSRDRKEKEILFFLMLHWVSLSFFFLVSLVLLFSFHRSEFIERKKNYIDITTVQSYRRMPPWMWQKTVILSTLERMKEEGEEYIYMMIHLLFYFFFLLLSYY